MKAYDQLSRAELIRLLAKKDQEAATSNGSLNQQHLQQHLVRELKAHHVELEMQNHELRAAQSLLEASRDGYADLYDAAPVGYLTLDRSGIILNANLTASELLGVDRTRLISVPFSRYVIRQDLIRWRHHMRRVLQQAKSEVMELRLAVGRSKSLPCLIRSCVKQATPGDDPVCRLVLTDIGQLKAAESALEDASALNQAVLSSLNSGICVLDRKGDVIFLNPIWEGWLQDLGEGNSCQRLDLGRNFFEVVGAAEGMTRECLHPLLDGVRGVLDRTRGRFVTEFRVLNARRPGWFMVVVTSLRSPGGGAVLSCTDISRRRSVEEALLDQQARLRSVLETAVDAIITIDEEGTIDSFNRSAERLFGYSLDEVVGKNINMLMPSPHREQHRNYLKNYRDTGERKIIGIGREVEGLRKDGTRVPLELSVSELRLVDGQRIFTGFVRDITHRRAAEEALRGSELRFRSLSEASPMGICLTDTNGRCTYTNPRWREMSGLNAEENLGDGWLKIVLAVDRKSLVEVWKSSLRREEELLSEFRMHRPDGAIKWIRTHFKPIRREDGAITGYVGVHEDITAAKRRERLLRLRYAVSEALGVSSSLVQVVPRLLEGIAKAFDWDVGEFWEVGSDAGSLRMIHVWSRSGKKLSAFVKRSLKLSLPMFDGLPGKVMASQKPEWIWPISRCLHFERAAQAHEAGLESALAFPIRLADHCLGVMAFLGHLDIAPDDEQLSFFSDLGTQIGQFMERNNAEAKLREANEFGKQVIAGAQAGIVVLDRESRFVVWNPFMEQLTGRPAREVLGRLAVEVFSIFSEPQFKGMFLRALAGEMFDAADLAMDLETREKRVWLAVRFAPLRNATDQIIGIIVAVRDITDRRRLEAEVLDISDREKQRIGHDLHDGLGQQLTALEMKCFLLWEEVGSQDLLAAREALRQGLEQLGFGLRECIATTRGLARGLAPLAMKGDGLAGGLRQLAQVSTVPGKVRCTFECDGPVILADPQVNSHLYRIAQEAVNNAIKHGQARSIRIRLSQQGDLVSLRVQDQGRGMPKRTKHKIGMGLEVMRHRAHVIGASLEIGSRPGKGVCITCNLPLYHYEHEQQEAPRTQNDSSRS